MQVISLVTHTSHESWIRHMSCMSRVARLSHLTPISNAHMPSSSYKHTLSYLYAQLHQLRHTHTDFYRNTHQLLKTRTATSTHRVGGAGVTSRYAARTPTSKHTHYRLHTRTPTSTHTRTNFYAHIIGELAGGAGATRIWSVQNLVHMPEQVH